MKQLTCAMALAVVLSACSGGQAPPAGNAGAGPAAGAAATGPVALPVVAARRGAVTRSVTLPAQVQPLRQAILYARVAGYLGSIGVDKGDHVKSGQLLAKVEVPELEAARARQQAEFAAAESDYLRLKESRERAPDLVVPQMLDQARGKYEIARASLQQSETMLGYANIVAPFAGVITQRFVDPGALIPAGGGAPVVTLMDFSSVRLQIAVPEQEAALVRAGQDVTVSSEDLAGTKFAAKITRFAYALDPATRTMQAEVVLPNPQAALRPGMLAAAKIGIQTHDKALLVPVAAIVTDKSGTYVWAHAGGQASKRMVKTAFTDGVNTEISEGLQEGDAVIVVGKATLKEGQAVTAQAAEARAPA